jgi:multidrug efflux pump subunit AcrA (membrane-fusion protein)
MRIRQVALLSGLVFALLFGCKADERSAIPLKSPRPISVLILKESDPSRAHRVAGSVASWKTEEIGFEVPGRVQYVIEPGTNVAGEIYDPDGKMLSQGTELARLDDARYQLHINSSEAKIKSAEEQKKVVSIEAEKVIPARQRAANADLRVAQAELERRIQMFKKQAISQEELEQAQGRWETARANTEQLVARREAKRAEGTSLDAEIRELEEALAEAQRDVADCHLVSPYSGQVADVHVIPGAYVQQGQRVVTVQMMDPISVEFEVAAKTARRMNYRDMIPIYVASVDGPERRLQATVYMTDPVADPETRTFTVTLLARNKIVRTPVPENMKDQPVVRTGNLWKILAELIDGSDRQFIEEKSIQEDAQGHFLWKVTNRQVATPVDGASPELKVTKIRVTPGERRVPFLDIWTFREVTIEPNQEFDPPTDLVTGALTFPQGVDEQTWQGDTILFDRQRWLLRPGDLVGVDLSGGKTQPGFYVPTDSILEKSGKHYVFAVESDDGGDRVRAVAVDVRQSMGTSRRIEATGDEPLTAGMRIASSGALFLTDGESVNVVEEAEVNR